MFFSKKEKEEKTITIKRLLLLLFKHQTYRGRDMEPYQVNRDLNRPGSNGGSSWRLANHMFGKDGDKTFYSKYKIFEKELPGNFPRLFGVHFQQKNLNSLASFIKCVPVILCPEYAKLPMQSMDGNFRLLNSDDNFTNLLEKESSDCVKHILTYGVFEFSNSGKKPIHETPFKIVFNIRYDKDKNKFFKTCDIEWIKFKKDHPKLQKIIGNPETKITKLQAYRILVQECNPNYTSLNERSLNDLVDKIKKGKITKKVDLKSIVRNNLQEIFIDLDLMFKGQKPELEPMEVKVPNEIEFAKLIFEGSLDNEDKFLYFLKHNNKLDDKTKKIFFSKYKDKLLTSFLNILKDDRINEKEKVTMILSCLQDNNLKQLTFDKINWLKIAKSDKCPSSCKIILLLPKIDLFVGKNSTNKHSNYYWQLFFDAVNVANEVEFIETISSAFSSVKDLCKLMQQKEMKSAEPYLTRLFNKHKNTNTIIKEYLKKQHFTDNAKKKLSPHKKLYKRKPPKKQGSRKDSCKIL
ncbi:MAG: hypothetical protein PVI75_04570 [Gammaproteobacteria bacterium]|jgi:hypothetical protein